MTTTRTTNRPHPHTLSKAAPRLVFNQGANAQPIDKTVVMTDPRDPQEVAAELTATVSHGQGISEKKLENNGFIDLKQDPEVQEILDCYRRNHPELQDTWDRFIRDTYILAPPADQWYEFDGVINEDKAKPIIYIVNKHDLVYQLTYLITKSHDQAQVDQDQYALGIAGQASDPERWDKDTIRAELDAAGDNYICRSISRAKYVQAHVPEFFSPDHFNRTLTNDLDFQVDTVSAAAEEVIPKIKPSLYRLYGAISGEPEEGYILEFVVVVNGYQSLKEHATKQLAKRLDKALTVKVTTLRYMTIGLSTLVKAAVSKAQDHILTPEQRLFIRLHREFLRVCGDPLLEERTDGFDAVLADNEIAYVDEKVDELYDLYAQVDNLAQLGDLTTEESSEAARLQRAVTRLIYEIEIAQAGPRFAPGSRIGKYEVIEKRAQGGFGSIFLVRDMDFDRVCVMKFITQDRAEAANFAGELAATDSTSARERAAGTARVLDRGFYADCLYMVQTFESGITLKDAWQQILKMSPLEKRVLMQLVVQRVHRINLHKKIAHRDIKPENVIVPADGNGHIALPPLPREVKVPDPSNKVLKEAMPGYFESAEVETFQAEIVIIDLGNAAEDRTTVREISGKSLFLTLCSIVLGLTFSAALGTVLYLTVGGGTFVVPSTHLWGYCAASLTLLALALAYRNRTRKVIEGDRGEGPLQATLAYFCPHQHMWVTSLSDVYALGGMYYKMVAADRFFNGQTRCLTNMDASVALRMKDHGDLWKFRNYKLWPSYAVNRRAVTPAEIQALNDIHEMAFHRLKRYSVIVSQKELPELIEKGMPETYLRYNPKYVSSPHRLRKYLSRHLGWKQSEIERILDVVVPRAVDERDEGCIMGALQYDLTERMTLKEMVIELNMINCGADNAELNYKAPWLGAGRMKVLFNSRLTVLLGKGYLSLKRAMRWWFVDHFKEGLLLTIAGLSIGAGAYIENRKQAEGRQQLLRLKEMLIDEGDSRGIDLRGLSVDQMYYWLRRYERAKQPKHSGEKQQSNDTVTPKDEASDTGTSPLQTPEADTENVVEPETRPTKPDVDNEDVGNDKVEDAAPLKKPDGAVE